MNHKVLLADDSLTIQKVIKITLANQPYDITEVSSEEELFHQLPIVQPKLVFLDFNLSERYTGYELTAKIKSLLPTTKVLLLLGTFDTVDDAAMEKCGASEKIVKPFDSNRFIAICKQLIETFADEEIAFPETHETDEFQPDGDDQWEMNHSTEQAFPQPITPSHDQSKPDLKNPLHQEMSDWGMSVPGVINDNEDANSMELPPVIGEVRPLHGRALNEASRDEPKFPDSDDLDYPTIEELTSRPEAEAPKPSSKLISIDNFKDAPSEIELEGNYVANDSDVKSIEDQIRDEVEQDLWKADEFEDIKQEVSSKIEDVKNNFRPTPNDFDESLFKPIDDPESINWEEATSAAEEVPEEKSSFEFPSEAQVDMNELRREMEEMVKKYVKEYMDEMFKKNTEKIAWEVIPDLAENLIRQELNKISNKIIKD